MAKIEVTHTETGRTAFVSAPAVAALAAAGWHPTDAQPELQQLEEPTGDDTTVEEPAVVDDSTTEITEPAPKRGRSTKPQEA